MNQNTADEIFSDVQKAIRAGDPEYVWKVLSKLVDWKPSCREPLEAEYKAGQSANVIRPQNWRGQVRGNRVSNPGPSSSIPSSGYPTTTLVPWRNAPGVTRPCNAGFNDLMPEYIRIVGNFPNSLPCVDYKGSASPDYNTDCILRRFRPLPPGFRPQKKTGDRVLDGLVDKIRLLMGYRPASDWGAPCWRSRSFFLGEDTETENWIQNQIELLLRGGEVDVDPVGTISDYTTEFYNNISIVWSLFWDGNSSAGKGYNDVSYQAWGSMDRKRQAPSYNDQNKIGNSQGPYIGQYLPQSHAPDSDAVIDAPTSVGGQVTEDGWVLSCDMLFVTDTFGNPGYVSPDFPGKYIDSSDPESRYFTGSSNLGVFKPSARLVGDTNDGLDVGPQPQVFNINPNKGRNPNNYPYNVKWSESGNFEYFIPVVFQIAYIRPVFAGTGNEIMYAEGFYP